MMKLNNIYLVYLKLFAILILLGLCLGGCTTQSAYIQDLNISAPINQTAIHFTDDSQMKHTVRIAASLTSNPRGISNSRIDAHTHVNNNETMQLDTAKDGSLYYSPESNNYEFMGSNFHWKYPVNTAAVSLDVVLSRYFILNGGINYSNIDNQEYFNQNAGLAWLSIGPNLAFRADAGYHFSWLTYNVSYVILNSPAFSFFNHPADASSVEQGSTHGRMKGINFYYAISVNTKRDDWLVNGIVKVSMDNQDLINYPPKPNRALLITENTAALLNITPALAFSAGESGHIIIGCSFIQNLAAKNDNNPFIGVPVMQFDWDL